jgi:hypothetical protein
MLPVKISNFSTENMFGCVAHVINLAAKAGIMYLGQNWLSRSQSTANLEFPPDENDAVLVGSDVVDPWINNNILFLLQKCQSNDQPCADMPASEA